MNIRRKLIDLPGGFASEKPDGTLNYWAARDGGVPADRDGGGFYAAALTHLTRDSGCPSLLYHLLTAAHAQKQHESMVFRGFCDELSRQIVSIPPRWLPVLTVPIVSNGSLQDLPQNPREALPFSKTAGGDFLLWQPKVRGDHSQDLATGAYYGDSLVRYLNATGDPDLLFDVSAAIGRSKCPSQEAVLVGLAQAVARSLGTVPVNATVWLRSTLPHMARPGASSPTARLDWARF